MNNEIYVIVWTGRDYDSDIWDTYPCLNFGYFTDKETADKIAERLNNDAPGEYDEQADDTSSYSAQKVLPYTKILPNGAY